MAAASTHDYAPPVPDEPFGQRGMRQYAGRIFAWLFFTAALSALAMGHRSDSYTDRAEWRGQGQIFRVTSGSGQLVLDGASDEKIKGDGTWTYRGGYGGNRWANRFTWASDLGRVFGVEGAWESQIRNTDTGFFLRVKWWVLAAVLMLQPALFVARRTLAWRRRRDADAVTAV